MLYAPGERPASGGCQTVHVRPGLRLTRALAAIGGSGALFAYALSGAPAGAADQTVQANAQNQFSPSSVTIDAGDTVTWQWAGGFGHTVTSSSANWSKDTTLGPGTSPGPLTTSQIFDKAGVYTYVCKTHGSAGMKGTVVVQGATKPKPTKTPPRSPSPTRTSSSPRPSRSSSSPEPSTSSATPILPGGTIPPGGSGSPTAPVPSVAPTPTESKFLGEGGLKAPPATGRGKGLPVMLALLLLGGVGSAEIRAYLSEDPY